MGGCCPKPPPPKVDTPPPEEDPDFDPTILEHVYIVGKEMGKGISVVKEGINKKTKERVAIKFIDKTDSDPGELTRLYREIENLKRLRHPNVLRLLDVFNTDTFIYMVTDFLPGGELFHKIVQRGIDYSERDAALIMRQVIEGVAHLHDEGIAHRDLKPENLLCSEGKEEKDGKEYNPFRIVIADFGLSKTFNDESTLITSCGTPEYVAPEVIEAEGHYDNAVDMWSVGVITYVLLCGSSPFGESKDGGALFVNIMAAQFEFPEAEWKGISDEAKDFIRHLIVKDTNERWTAEEAKEHVWLTGTCGTDAPLAGGDITRRITTYNLKMSQRRTFNKDVQAANGTTPKKE